MSMAWYDIRKSTRVHKTGVAWCEDALCIGSAQAHGAILNLGMMKAFKRKLSMSCLVRKDKDVVFVLKVVVAS